MARIRSLKPEFFTDEKIGDLSPWARLCFQGLWTQADARGRMEDRPRFLKVQIFPYDELDINELLDQLHGAGFIIRYEVDGKRYIQVVNFEKHQRLSGKEASAPSTIPALPGCYSSPKSEATEKQSEPTCEAQENTCEAVRIQEGSGGEAPVKHLGSARERTGAQERKGKEGNGKEGGVGETIEKPPKPPSLPAAEIELDFERFWEAYPPRSGDRKRAEALAKYGVLRRRGVDANVILGGARRYRRFCDATLKTKTEFVQQASTWLNGRAWENEFDIPDDAPNPPPKAVFGMSPDLAELVQR